MRWSWWQLVGASMVVLALVAPACSGDDEGGGGGGDGKVTGCAADGGLRTAGRITIATTSPAVAPWFEDDDPANGKGFESEVAYAVAGEMGLGPERIEWARSSLADAIAEGEKAFDVFLGQAVVNRQRREAVDLSEPYFALAQAVLVPADGPGVDVESVADVAALRLGVLADTSSAGYVTGVLDAPDPVELADDAAVAAAFAAGDVDAVVVDVATAVRLTGVVEGSRVVGQIGERPERFAFVLERDSELTDCVDRAVERLAEAGTLQVLEQSYLTQLLEVPALAR